MRVGANVSRNRVLSLWCAQVGPLPPSHFEINQQQMAMVQAEIDSREREQQETAEQIQLIEAVNLDDEFARARKKAEKRARQKARHRQRKLEANGEAPGEQDSPSSPLSD